MYRNLLLFFCLLGFCAACVPARSAVSVAPVTGKVTEHKLPVAGVRVAAWPVDAPSLAPPPPFLSAPTSADGLFRLELPAGEYYLMARGGGLFSFYGRNPLAIPSAGVTDISLALVPEGGETTGESSIETGVAGRVVHNGVPLAGATIYVYTDLTGRLKGMGYAMAGPTDADGFFEVDLPAGTYYLMARFRHGAGGVGPLRAGDFIGYFPGNPLTVKDGAVSRVLIPALEVPEKVEQMAASLFGETGIQGRVVDRQGQPVKGVRAILYADPKMLDRPLYVSRPSGDDGTFTLSFPYGGTYYLAARDTLGGAPGSGELYGTYDATPDHSLQLTTGEVRRDIDIVVEPMW